MSGVTDSGQPKEIFQAKLSLQNRYSLHLHECTIASLTITIPFPLYYVVCQCDKNFREADNHQSLFIFCNYGVHSASKKMSQCKDDPNETIHCGNAVSIAAAASLYTSRISLAGN